MPIADDNSGDWLFVDLRPGERHGCVGKWWGVGGFQQRPIWPGVAEMAEAIIEALDVGLWAPDDTGELDMEPLVEDGVLRWEDADNWETIPRSGSPTPAR